MSPAPRLLLAAALATVATTARAGETACWFEHGMVVAPASVMGVAGDYIVDTATPVTQMHLDVAQGAGFATTDLVGEVRFAGFDLPARPIQVLALDSRGWMLATPLAGVIGADILRNYVVDVSFAPCRLHLWPVGRARPLAGGRSLPLVWIGGRPTVSAAVADGPTARAGAFAVATSLDAPVRLSDRIATVPAAPKPAEVYLNGVAHPRLRALSLAGQLSENLVSGLEPDTGADGVIGAAVLSHWRLRFDFPADRLLLAAP